ncbi:MAG TPA: GMC family oxidoreductase [Conexibacter sp.]|jgi:cholesterol oxidase|nr:GMC family oxidoreductase [Conexibacter sp.]
MTPLNAAGSQEHVDAVIVGSGFGGSVTAYRLAKEGIGVCLLERGKPYPPGSFARTPREMRRNFWDPSEGMQGLFDIWSFRGIDAVVSSGLGGGSLIYANVFIRKDEHWFDSVMPDGTHVPWPVTRAQLDPHYDQVHAIINPTPYPFAHAPYSETPKTRAYKEAAARAGVEWFLPDLAITFGADPAKPVIGEQIPEAIPNVHGMPRSTCRLVGECDVGCNYGAKNSLDYTYLSLAAHHGADLRTRHEVRSFAPRPGGGWLVRYVEHTDEHEGARFDTATLPERELACERLILSAGALGTPYLLLRNADALGGLPPALGTRFSGNGDLLSFITNARRSDGRPWPLESPIGPAITSTIRVPDENDPGGTGPGYYIQEGGFPAWASWLQEGLDLPGELRRVAHFVLRRVWAQIKHSPQSEIGSQIADVLDDADQAATLLPMLGMGRDTPDGRYSLDDGMLALDWTEDTSEVYLKRVRATMEAINDQLGGDWVQNPLSHLHRLITVHPLGGAPMGTDPQSGVVDAHGRVFGHPGLHVADGSVVPGPVGPNPSFTIAALADRFADAIVAEHQGRAVEAAA